MITCEELEQKLRDVLNHLYDPGYRPPDALFSVMGYQPYASDVLEIQTAIIQSIGELKPPPGIPSNAQPSRVYELLYNRFVLRLTQEETAERLHISVATAWRVQKEAVHALARHLWERYVERQRSAKGQADMQPMDWRAQAERELASLQASGPGAETRVAEAIKDVLEMWNLPAVGKDVRLKVEFMQPDLITPIHPVVLRQVLITAVKRLTGYMQAGDEIKVFVTLEEGDITVTLTALVASDRRPTVADLTRDILLPEGVSIQPELDGNHIFWRARLPALGRVTVLVVDDNPDMVEMYRRSAEGTKYHIVRTAQGSTLFQVVESVAPDIIVLDVMLPDVDGWKLLMRLRENPATRHIPVIVCSVVREEDLALSLGAAQYLAKPIRPRQFIEALDRVLNRSSESAERPPLNNASAG